MKIELFAVADFAVEQAGKLTIVGVFDTLCCHSLPVVHELCAVVAKLRFEKIEEGTKRVRLNLSDADGKLVLPSVDLPLDVRMNEDQHTLTKNIVVKIGGLKIEKEGEYSFDLAVDGRHEASIPLFVRVVQSLPPLS